MHRRSLLFLPLLLSLSACGGRPDPDQVVPVGPPARVEVKNLHALPVEIDVAGNGTILRLGTVHPGMEASFEIPLNLTINGSAEIVVLPKTNARPFRSEPLLLHPGSVVDLVVTPRLFNSTATIRN